MTQVSTLSPAVASLVAASATDVVKLFGSGDTAVRALDRVSIDLLRGEFTAIMGPSGSGKSTLMHCLAGLDTVTSGSVAIGDVELCGLSDKKMTALRRDRIGFVFQSFNLVPTLTALENITLPIAIAGRKPAQPWLDNIIATLGLTDRLHHRPSELSGGQQQRVVPWAARWPAGRRSSSGTSPPATSTRAPVARSWASCAARSTISARRS
jgi:putative ABC transport system ATP-binding protein